MCYRVSMRDRWWCQLPALPPKARPASPTASTACARWSPSAVIWPLPSSSPWGRCAGAMSHEALGAEVAALVCGGNRGGTLMHAELTVNLAQMGFDGGLADEQCTRDLRI